MGIIGYILASNKDSPLPSTRISASNLFKLLPDYGFNPIILDEPSAINCTRSLDGLAQKAAYFGMGEGDIAYFQKVYGPSAHAAAVELSRLGIKTVFGICDLVEDTMARICDAVIVPCEELRKLYPADLQYKVHVVHDGIEM